MENNTNDTSGGILLGLIIGGALWWFDVVGIIAAFFIAVIIGGIVSATGTEIKKNNNKDDKILAHFERMPKPKRKVQGKKPTEDDDFDLPGYGVAIWESSEGVPINFNYVDTFGDYTERTVIIHKMTKDSKTRFYFQGYCLLRKATRTFNSENIQDIYDMNGEIIEVPDFINKLAGYEAYGNTEVQEVAKKPKKKKQS